jgi:hypothetical protein
MQLIFSFYQIAVFLTIAHVQSATINQLQRPVDNVKNKRGLYSFEDAIIGPPPPQPFQTINYGQPSYRGFPTPNKWTNVFGFDDITYNHLFNELNGINYGIPTHITPPPPTAYPPAPYPVYKEFSNNGYGYVNYGAPRVQPHDYESTYISHDGRVVKQYSVHERHHNDHPDPRSFQPASIPAARPAPPQQFSPFFPPPNINLAQPRTLFTSPRNPNPNQVPTFLNRNHGPVALGSGSLGVVQLANGDVFLGSGSLGYISHKGAREFN